MVAYNESISGVSHWNGDLRVAPELKVHHKKKCILGVPCCLAVQETIASLSKHLGKKEKKKP